MSWPGSARYLEPPAPSQGPTLSTPWRYTWPEAVWAFSGHSVSATVLVSFPGSAQWLSGK